MSILSCPQHSLLSLKFNPRHSTRRHVSTIRAFQRSDFDGFAKRVKSGEAWRDAWRTANDRFELLVFEARKTAERLDRQYLISRKVDSVVQSATLRAREIDREFEIGQRWRTFSLDFSRNWPRYRKQLNDFFDSPLGRSSATIFFLWFALSGWLFRIFIFAVWVLPFAGPFLIGTVANNFVIKGNCPACKKQFVGYKSQRVQCSGCGNTVWQPTAEPFAGGNKRPTSSKSQPGIIDVEFEEK